jgi:CO/xanthine dehydrogenase Mo-binding subunit
VVEIKDGHVTCWSGSQKPHFVRDGIARTLGMPADKVDCIWVVGPGSYGRNDADDCANDAAVLARAIGRPVRLQYTREQGTGWDPKGPASIHRARAAIDASGKVVAYEFISKGFSRFDVMTNGSQPADTLAGHFRGVPLKVNDAFGVPAESYAFANKRTAWETIAPLLERASPLRSAHLRDPVGPQIHFASESFMDEVAAALSIDPIELRLRHVQSPRDVAVLKAAPRRPWQSGSRAGPDRQRVGPQHRLFATHRTVVRSWPRSISTAPGKIWARSSPSPTIGQIINPDGLAKCIEGNIVQGVSRTLWEEVTFDRKAVTSVDWLTYPILDITETPDEVNVVLINHPEIAPTGAGEPSIRPVAAAIANAIFDATGVRVRRVPFSPDRVKQALS